LTQMLGSWHHLMAYLSKQLDTVSWGWPHYPCTMVVTAVLVAKAEKLTLGQELTVWVPHSILTLMEYKGNYWLTNFWMVKYQSMLCENPCIRLEFVDSKPSHPFTSWFRPLAAWQFRGYGWGFLQLARLDWPGY
jgi:hypothetical protein